jgi:hypothetical protein
MSIVILVVLIASLLEQLGVEIFGGLVAAILAAAIVVTWPKISREFRCFEIRFMPAGQPIAPENMKQGTGLELFPGLNRVWLSIRLRDGVDLKYIGFRFFDNAPFHRRILPKL